jgi:hypothetical protein
MIMKKTLLALALAATTFAASAGVTAFTTYDYSVAEHGAWQSQHEVHLGAAVDTKLGTVDAAVVGRQLVTSTRDNNLGYEIGYSNGLKIGKIGFTGRAAYGRVNQVDLKTGSSSGNNQYYSLAAEASAPVVDGTSAFVGYRMRNGLNSATPAVQNQVSLGLDFKVAKSSTLRTGFTAATQNGGTSYGATTGLSVKF